MVQALKKGKFKGVEGPLLTIVMDGVGLAPDNGGNAVAAAHTPTLDRLMRDYPTVRLKAHGTAVGLPSDDDMGNSEVGHNALGAGQVFAQGAKLVSNSIESGKIFDSDSWKAAVGQVKSNAGTLHFLGLCIPVIVVMNQCKMIIFASIVFTFNIGFCNALITYSDVI